MREQGLLYFVLDFVLGLISRIFKLRVRHFIVLHLPNPNGTIRSIGFMNHGNGVVANLIFLLWVDSVAVRSQSGAKV
jgi:hypothetical protein